MFIVPRVTSKSSAKATGCEYHFLHTRCSEVPAVRVADAEITDVGHAMHHYRSIYIDHLVDVNYRRDPDWAMEWLARQSISDEARDLICDDIRTFEVDPQIVIGVELGLAMDCDMNPLDRQYQCDGPFISSHTDAAVTTTIDLLLIEGKRARVCDQKSGWSTINIHDAEPAFYAGAVFAHFPRVETVSFVWEFSRVRRTREVTYKRSDLPAIKSVINSVRATERRIVEQANAGQQPTVNPMSGLCAWCTLPCPAKQGLTAPLDLPPIQELTDAQRVAGIVYIAQIVAEKGREALKAWIDGHGPVELPNDWLAEITVADRRHTPLVAALRILGLDVVPREWLEKVESEYRPKLGEVTPAWDIPFKDLQIARSPLASKMKAKKRAGLEDAMNLISISTPINTLAIHKKDEELPEQKD